MQSKDLRLPLQLRLLLPFLLSSRRDLLFPLCPIHRSLITTGGNLDLPGALVFAVVSPYGKIESSGDPHVLFKVRQTSRPLLPLLPSLRSHHLRRSSTTPAALSEPQPTHAPAQQP